MTDGMNGANDSIRQQEKHIIEILEEAKKHFEYQAKDINMALDYYRLKEGGTHSDEELDHKFKDSKGNEHSVMKPIPTIKQSKHYIYEKTRENMLTSLRDLYHDNYEYPKNMYNTYSEIMNIDFDTIKNFLEANEVDTY